ncbi:TLDc domain-containing protein [Entamoeba marina]
MEWSNKTTFNVIFDSDIDGDGTNNVLHNTVFNKSNLYFITFDSNDNVFGGYVNNKIDRDGWINDKKVFMISLFRNGEEKNSKYLINPFYSTTTFYLHNNNQYSYLYQFSDDVFVRGIGNETFCQCRRFNCNNEKNPLIGTTSSGSVRTERIIIIEMN